MPVFTTASDLRTQCFVRPLGLVLYLLATAQGLRRGLYSFAPSGLVVTLWGLPTACAVGCVLVLLQGWAWVGFVSEHSRLILPAL